MDFGKVFEIKSMKKGIWNQVGGKWDRYAQILPRFAPCNVISPGTALQRYFRRSVLTEGYCAVAHFLYI